MQGVLLVQLCIRLSEVARRTIGGRRLVLRWEPAFKKDAVEKGRKLAIRGRPWHPSETPLAERAWST